MKEDTMLETRRPKLFMLSESFIDQIVSEALDVLGKTGVLVENENAIRLLTDAGCECKGQLAGDLYGNIYDVDHLLTSKETLRWFQEELDQAGPVIDRDTYDVWRSHGKKSAWDRACVEVERIMSSHTVEPLADDSLKALKSIMKGDAQRMGFDLPPLA